METGTGRSSTMKKMREGDKVKEISLKMAKLIIE
jgi:hypothetical protein